jgi:hypothetical protein
MRSVRLQPLEAQREYAIFKDSTGRSGAAEQRQWRLKRMFSMDFWPSWSCWKRLEGQLMDTS